MPVSIQVAPLATDANNMRWYTGVSPTQDPTLLYQSGKAGVGFSGKTYGLLREVIKKDGFIYGLIQARQSAVMERLMYLRDADVSDEATSATAVARAVLNCLDRESARTGGLAGDMRQMLDAPHFGCYVGKVIWDYRTLAPRGANRKYSRQMLVPVNLIQEDLDRTAFDSNGNLLIYAQITEAEAAAYSFTKGPQQNWWYPHPFSYFVLTPYAYGDRPVGEATLATVFYAAWFKRNVRTWHAQFIERNTSPVATVESVPMAQLPTTEDKEAIDAMLNDVAQQTGLRLPPGFSFKWHELLSNASAQAIADFQIFCDREAAAAILGQPSTSMSASNATQKGSEVHERVAQGIVTMDAQIVLQGGMNHLINMICMLNTPDLSPEVWPSWIVQTETAADLAKRAEVFTALISLDVPITKAQARREFLIDEAMPGDELLSQLPAPYAGDPSGQPSQQRPEKTAARQRQREKNSPSKGESQPPREKLSAPVRERALAELENFDYNLAVAYRVWMEEFGGEGPLKDVHAALGERYQWTPTYPYFTSKWMPRIRAAHDRAIV